MLLPSNRRPYLRPTESEAGDNTEIARSLVTCALRSSFQPITIRPHDNGDADHWEVWLRDRGGYTVVLASLTARRMAF